MLSSLLLYPTLLNTMLFKASYDSLVLDDIARQASISTIPHDLPIFTPFFYYIVIFLSNYQNPTFMAYLTDTDAVICLFEPAMPCSLGKKWF